jgi:hypothetical protein
VPGITFGLQCAGKDLTFSKHAQRAAAEAGCLLLRPVRDYRILAASTPAAKQAQLAYAGCGDAPTTDDEG